MVVGPGIGEGEVAPQQRPAEKAHLVKTRIVTRIGDIRKDISPRSMLTRLAQGKSVMVPSEKPPLEDIQKVPEGQLDVGEIADAKLKGIFPNGLWHRLGVATRPSATTEENRDEKGVVTKTHRERSLATRVWRAQKFREVQGLREERKELSKSNKEQKSDETTERISAIDKKAKEISQEKQDLDRIARQHFEPKEVVIETSEFGELPVRYSVFEPPERTQTEASKQLPPVIVLPPLVAGMYANTAFNQALALREGKQGRRVIVIAHPESFLATTTDKFKDAVIEAKDASVHAAFFKAAIDKIVGSETAVSLWGYSYGAAVAAEMSQDEVWQKKLADMTLIFPAAVVDRPFSLLSKNPLRSLQAGLLHDFWRDIRTPSGRRQVFALNGLVKPTPKDKDNPNRVRVGELHSHMVDLMKDDIGAVDPQKMRVRQGGDITVVLGGQDEVTKSHELFDGLVNSNNPQISVIELEDAPHHRAMTHPEDILNVVPLRNYSSASKSPPLQQAA